ncbi:MAG: FHA domain-containing protein [Anaerolineales bacterium]
MMTLKRIILIVSLVTMLSIPAMELVSAQTASAIRVNQVSTLETQNGVNLKIYFNVFDPKTGAPILDAEPSSANVTLLFTNLVSQGQVKKPDTPIYITMVLDSSGSMAGTAADKLKQAAKQALNNIPDNSFFSVIQFDNASKLLQDFTQNISLVSDAIDHYKVSPNATCLYDAAYSAVQTLSKAPPGRRAVIIFTDGKDEKGDGTPCSKHSYQELVTLANQMQVPVNTIGLANVSSDINSGELQDMAVSTGGFSAIGGQADLSVSFSKIMDALKAQWMVEALVYPRQGSNDCTLTVLMKDNQSLNSDFNFTSSTNYPGPPSPVTAQFSGLLFHPDNSTYDIQLSLTSPDLVSYVKVSIWDKKAGSKVAEYVFNNPVDSNTFNFATDQLTVGSDYELHIIAVSRADNTPFPLTRDSQGNTSAELIHDFTFDPSALFPQITIQSVAQQSNDIAVTITTSNTDLIGGFNGWLIDENTNTRVQNSDFKIPALGTSSGTIVIPAGASKVPDGKYTLVVQVLGKSNQVYSSVNYSGVVYTAKRPSVIQNIWVALVASPILMGLIIVIILGVVGYFMYMSMRSKSMTGTPVMQGRLGEKLSGGRSSGTPLPLADNEPIPMRGQPAGQPARSAPQPFSPPPSQMASSRPAAVGRDDRTMLAGGEGATLIAAQPVPAKASLLIVRSPEDASSQGHQVAMTQFPFIIGRVEGSLIIKDPNISRRHAQVTFEAASRTYFITDLNSSNGTRLNEQRLAQGQPVQLTGGAVIGLGPNVTLRFDLS